MNLYMRHIVIPPKLLEDWTALYWDNLDRAEAERRFLNCFMDGRLYISQYRRDDLARVWAAEPGIIRNYPEYARRLNWLQTERWETGVYFGCWVIVFIKFKSANEIVRLRLYRLDGKRFGEYFAKGDEYIDLDPEGNLIEIVDPLPGVLNVDPAAFWRGFDYMRSHGGLTPEQVKAAQQKRKQPRKEVCNND